MRILLLAMVFCLFSCQAEIENNSDSNNSNSSNNSGTGPQISSDALYYYKANIGGTWYTEKVTATNDFEVGCSNNGYDDIEVGSWITPMTGLPTPPANATSLGVFKSIFHGYINSTVPQFKAYFSPGTYPFATRPDGTTTLVGDSIHVYWTDPQGNEWGTRYGSRDQTGSDFKIISTVDDPDPMGN